MNKPPEMLPHRVVVRLIMVAVMGAVNWLQPPVAGFGWSYRELGNKCFENH
jgi:hypothetical protein